MGIIVVLLDVTLKLKVWEFSSVPPPAPIPDKEMVCADASSSTVISETVLIIGSSLTPVTVIVKLFVSSLVLSSPPFAVPPSSCI